VLELIPGEHYLVLFVEPGDMPDEETIEELRILAYARRRRDTLGSSKEAVVAALAQAASADGLTGSVWARCQAAISYVRNYRVHAVPREVDLGRLAESALETIGSAEVPDPIITAYSKIEVKAPGGGYQVTVQSHGTPVNVIIDDARRLVDVIIGTPGVAAVKRLGPRPLVETARTATGHVFVSYIREDIEQADDLCDILNEARIPVWRDTADLWPGEDWRAKIRQEITAHALVFLACFSRQSISKNRSFQREELNLAIGQIQLRPSDQPWLIPVRFDDCEIPDLDIGGMRTLSQLQRLDLFGDDYTSNADRLVTTVQHILDGPNRMDVIA
jgi:hypothetical protein